MGLEYLPENAEESRDEKIKPPKVLFHASPNRDIVKLNPRNEGVRDPEEGPVVFGTPDIAYASCFLTFGTNDSWIKIARWSNDPKNPGAWHFICGDEEEFRKRDKGGTIYTMSPEGFYTDPNKGTGTSEWVSKESVEPIGKIEYDSAFEAMIENGVQVIFTDKETMEEMKKSTDHGGSIVRGLVSENKKMGRNYHPVQ